MRYIERVETVDVKLPAMPILAGLDEAALEIIASGTHREVFQPGESILREGESGNHMYWVESGSARVFKTCEFNEERELAILGPGDTFGEGCILTTLPRIASVQAITEMATLSFSSMTFYRLYRRMADQYSILMLNIARDLSRRLRRLDQG